MQIVQIIEMINNKHKNIKFIMKNENGLSIWEEIKLDYVFSWKLLKQNYNALF